jgi:hypothetical protein
VGAIYAVGGLLSAVGFLAAGVATLRARLWSGWRRFTPIAVGIWTTALMAPTFTKALPTGVAVYGLCLLALSLALYTRPVPYPEATLSLRPQERAT